MTKAVLGGSILRLVAAAALLVGLSGAGQADTLDLERLRDAQAGLMTQEVTALRPRVAGKPNVYAISVAAQGSQQIFAREAQLALRVLAARFAGDYRGGMLLSNGAVDLFRHPVAAQGSIAAAARAIAERADPAQDVTIVYLTSHGSPDAFIATDLPNEDRLTPISAASLAEGLAWSGVKRRVIIVSACFSGSWIPALANDDTIVITAAADDRSSFGCDDTRRLTFFGEAFLEGPLARGASLRDAFEAMKRTVGQWEAQGRLVPSLPQAYVGRNMQALWTQGGAVRPGGK